MRKPKFKQNAENFERLLHNRELIVYGKSKDVKQVCENYKVKYIVDKNDELQDLTVGDIKIYSPDKLYSENPDKVVVLVCAAGKYSGEITDTIEKIDDFVVFYWNVLNNKFLNEFSCELYDAYERIHSLEGRLYDDYSRKVLRESVVRRIIGMNAGYADLKIANEIQYLFPPALFCKSEGAVLDCGGYIGDSIDRFINRLGNGIEKIYTFEALPTNIDLIEKKKQALQESWAGEIQIIPYALADKEGMITFWETAKNGGCFSPDFRNATKWAYTNPVNKLEVKTVKIDDVVPESEKVRYIKMDIEGAEYAALLGAENTIKREKPGLAISIYHNASDYYRLAELLIDYIPEYKLAVRHHKDGHVDSVLYAWI